MGLISMTYSITYYECIGHPRRKMVPHPCENFMEIFTEHLLCVKILLRQKVAFVVTYSWV